MDYRRRPEREHVYSRADTVALRNDPPLPLPPAVGEVPWVPKRFLGDTQAEFDAIEREAPGPCDCFQKNQLMEKYAEALKKISRLEATNSRQDQQLRSAKKEREEAETLLVRERSQSDRLQRNMLHIQSEAYEYRNEMERTREEYRNYMLEIASKRQEQSSSSGGGGCGSVVDEARLAVLASMNRGRKRPSGNDFPLAPASADFPEVYKKPRY